MYVPPLVLMRSSRPPPLSQGNKGDELARATWQEVIEALVKEKPELKEFIALQ